MKEMKAFYRDLRIKHKMFILISLILLCFSIGGLFILQYAFNVYNEEIHRQSAQSLRVSSTSIEYEIERMEELSYQISTDQYIQSYLFALKSSDDTSTYEKFIISTKLKERLLEMGAFNNYVDSIQVYDLKGQAYTAGIRTIQLEDKRLSEIKRETSLEKGGVQWFFPDESDPSFIAARDVRSYLDLSFERLGLVAVRFNMEKLISTYAENLDYQETKMLVFNSDNELVFPIEPSEADQYMVDNISGTDGYELLEYNDEKFFVSFSPANYTNWTYMIVSPYENLFQAISSVRNAVLTIYLVMFIILMFIGMRFIGGVTGPIESLNKKMRRVQTGEFSHIHEENDGPSSKDEAGYMHENFNKMMSQINFLIEENYKKQLVIKDSEFKTLQAQINPHFLYNTLESINWAAKLGANKEVSKMAESLGFILRSSLETKDSLVSLEEEMKIINHYITIQSCRFEERLVFHNAIPDSLLSCKVPKFSLQPLVENAIRYGLQEKIGTCTITIRAKYSNDYVVVTVEDDGPGMEKEFLKQLASGNYEAHGTGIGLKNINERLGILFGEVYGIEVESEKNKGTKVHMLIPYEGGIKHVSSAVGR